MSILGKLLKLLGVTVLTNEQEINDFYFKAGYNSREPKFIRRAYTQYSPKLWQHLQKMHKLEAAFLTRKLTLHKAKSVTKQKTEVLHSIH